MYIKSNFDFFIIIVTGREKSNIKRSNILEFIGLTMSCDFRFGLLFGE